jgi:hypothetical protein
MTFIAGAPILKGRAAFEKRPGDEPSTSRYPLAVSIIAIVTYLLVPTDAVSKQLYTAVTIALIGALLPAVLSNSHLMRATGSLPMIGLSVLAGVISTPVFGSTKDLYRALLVAAPALLVALISSRFSNADRTNFRRSIPPCSAVGIPRWAEYEPRRG